MRVPISVHSRYIRLSRQDAEILFGSDTYLTINKPLPQPGHFIANEMVTITGPSGQISDIHVVGPRTKQSYVAVLDTDTSVLGVDIPTRLPGNIKGSAGIEIIGPNGSVFLQQGLLIIPKHLRMTVAQSEETGLKDGQKITISVGNPKKGIYLNDVIVSVRDDYVLDLYINTDEASNLCISKGERGKIII